jgi:AcrR family transcriptional regulator
VDAAVEVLAERGTDHTRFADVAERCGVAVSTLQCYFGSREDMLIEALRRAIVREVEATEATAAGQADPWRRLVALVERALRTDERDRCLLMELWRATLRDDELAQFCLSLRDRCRRPYLDAIAEGRAAGLFHPAHDPRDVVDVLTASLCGLSHPWAVPPPASGDRRHSDVLLAQLRGALGVVATDPARDLAARCTITPAHWAETVKTLQSQGELPASAPLGGGFDPRFVAAADPLRR